MSSANFDATSQRWGTSARSTTTPSAYEIMGRGSSRTYKNPQTLAAIDVMEKGRLRAY